MTNRKRSVQQAGLPSGRGRALRLTLPPRFPTMVRFTPEHTKRRTDHGRSEATNVSRAAGQAPQPPAPQAAADPVLPPLQRAEAAAPRMRQLRLLSESRRGEVDVEDG